MIPHVVAAQWMPSEEALAQGNPPRQMHNEFLRLRRVENAHHSSLCLRHEAVHTLRLRERPHVQLPQVVYPPISGAGQQYAPGSAKCKACWPRTMLIEPARRIRQGPAGRVRLLMSTAPAGLQLGSRKCGAPI